MIYLPLLSVQPIPNILLKVRLSRVQFFLQHESLHYLQVRAMLQVHPPLNAVILRTG